MRSLTTMTRRAILPLAVFVAAASVHFGWLATFPEHDAAQDRWAVLAPAASVLTRYRESQSYWLGYSYGLSLAFAAVALRGYRQQRSCAARNLAIGGVTLTGFVAVAGCFLLGCCGSPMLGVYLSLLGAAFLPFTKPLIACINTLLIVGSYWGLRRHQPAPQPRIAEGCCQGFAGRR